ncbi:hypothetical protein D3C75_588510 [compost metagenome]
MLDHAGGDHPRAGGELAVQADQLFLEQCQGLRHADQHHVERPFGARIGRHEPHGVRRQAVARQVLVQRQGAEERVAAADHRGMGCQGAGQGAEAVVEQQYAAARGEALLVQVLEQVFVGGVEGL